MTTNNLPMKAHENVNENTVCDIGYTGYSVFLKIVSFYPHIVERNLCQMNVITNL